MSIDFTEEWKVIEMFGVKGLVAIGATRGDRACWMFCWHQ